ncbi:MAG: Ribonuclease D [Candidatus Heimdallarchaeota archaeon LC_2]|nr:MAG: Ribonuclease D [Candidatus Heimdallarchaeota archaeon LC_2]
MEDEVIFISEKSQVKFITSVQELTDNISRMLENGITEIGIDLESNSLYRYKHEICLLQISIGNEIWLIDTLITKCPPAIKKLLEDPSITKIFQDMQYDLALLHYNHGCYPKNVFDISLGDRLVRKSNNNRKLAKIANDYLHFEIDASTKSQKSNWGNRPLSEEQIQYASDDVRYLIDIYKAISPELENDYRYDCMIEYMKNYNVKDYRRKYNINSMWKIKYIEELNQDQLFRLQNLLITRNNLAKRSNRPIFWFCNDRVLRDLAKSDLDSEDQIRKFFVKEKSLNRFVQRGIKDIVKAYLNKRPVDVHLDEPEFGVSLRTWVPIEDNHNINYHPNPTIILVIKEWQNQIINILGILPEFLRERGEIAYYASIPIDEWKQNIKFPGIPKYMHLMLIEDLIQFLETQQSKITLEVFFNTYKQSNSNSTL